MFCVVKTHEALSFRDVAILFHPFCSVCTFPFFFSLSLFLFYSFFRPLDICRCCNEVYETHSCPFSPCCLSVTKRISLVGSYSRWHVHVIASNSRKTNYKWRTGTRLLDSRDRFVIGLPSLFGHLRFDLHFIHDPICLLDIKRYA